MYGGTFFRRRRRRFVCFIFLFNATTRARAYISICLRAVLVSLAEYFIHDHEPCTDTLKHSATHTKTTNQFDGYATTLFRNPLFNFVFNAIPHLLQVDYAFIAHKQRQRASEIISIDNTCYRSMLDLVFYSAAKMRTRVFKKNWYPFK